MTTVYVNGNKISTFDAIIWAKDQFGSEAFKIITPFPGQNWQFKFIDAGQATLFALKWT
jgi:hypothetical protein